MTTLSPLSAQLLGTAMRPEIELLLHCARTSIDASRTERIKALLREDIDWQYLIRTAHAQGVTPLLYRSLHSNCPEAIPKIILNQLQRHFHANSFHNLFLARELLKIFKVVRSTWNPSYTI